jgi:hypothetical protein
VAARLQGQLAALGKPWVAHFVGAEAPTESLEACALAAVAAALGEPVSAAAFLESPADIEGIVESAADAVAPGRRLVRGVYSGGTLAWEALHILKRALPGVAPGVTGDGAGHRVVDLGEDVFTVGRPHPMLDGSIRRDWIAREARDAATGVLLLDLVLGHGAHPDPAGELLPALEAVAAGRGGPVVVASVTGTDADPQNRSAQVATLQSAGVLVMPSNARAAHLAARLATRLAKKG